MRSERLNWKQHGSDWPNREASRFVRADGIDWHVQVFGDGPCILLLHGTGAATHSWRAFAPLLAQHFTVVAPDLPGHGFTNRVSMSQASLPGMAAAVSQMLSKLRLSPQLAVGHSAGAAVLLQMCLTKSIAPAGVVSINGALLPMRGLLGQAFSTLAKVLMLNPFVPKIFAWRASDRHAVERVIANTGSAIEKGGIDLYWRLFKNERHVEGALAMMANWNLDQLKSELKMFAPELWLVHADGDRAVSPADGYEIKAILSRAELIKVPVGGHLVHEEQPEAICELVLKLAEYTGTSLHGSE